MTFSTAQAFATVVSTAFFGSLHWAASVAGKSELTQLSQNRASDQHRGVDKTRPQGENRLAQDTLGNDFPGENPWWRRMWDSIIGDAQAGDGKDGVTFPPNPNLIHHFNLPGHKAPSVGAMRRNEYVGVPKHGSVARGRAGAAPVNGQSALDVSVQVKPTSPTRVGIDYQTGDFVVFHENFPGQGVFSGHVRPWEGPGALTPEMRSGLIKSGLTTPRGAIIY